VADSIREALTQAFEADPSVNETPAAAPVTETPAPVTPTESIADPAAAVIGGKPETPAKPAAPAAKPAAVAPKPGATEQAPPVVGAPTTAPASWKMGEKKFWDQLPAEAKAAVQRRELETQRALSTSADARRHQETFQKVMHPYQPMLDAYGVKNPIDALVPLMQTRAALEVGTPDQKAQLIANLVHQFKIDITKLDGYLVSGPQAQLPIQQQQQPSFDPRSIPELAPLFQIAEQYKSAQAAKVDSAIEEVSSLPNFEDLREDMADILDLAASKGRSLTIKQAYDQAALMAGLSPSPVTAQPNVSEAAAIMARSRRAASSVAGAPKGGTGTPSTTLRGAIEAAMEG
jgi:hypothetical protein